MKFGWLLGILAIAIVFPYSVYAEVSDCVYKEEITIPFFNIEQTAASRSSDGSGSESGGGSDGGSSCSGCFIFGGDTLCCYRAPQPANGGGCGLVCNKTSSASRT
jgi:uncharacterized membrane protein YgcG